MHLLFLWGHCPVIDVCWQMTDHWLTHLWRFCSMMVSWYTAVVCQMMEQKQKTCVRKSTGCYCVYCCHLCDVYLSVECWLQRVSFQFGCAILKLQFSFVVWYWNNNSFSHVICLDAWLVFMSILLADCCYLKHCQQQVLIDLFLIQIIGSFKWRWPLFKVIDTTCKNFFTYSDAQFWMDQKFALLCGESHACLFM